MRAWEINGDNAKQRTPEITKSVRVESQHGVFHLPDDNHGDPVLVTMKNSGLFEPDVILECLKHIRPGTAVIDVGCNWGQMTIQFSRAVGPTGVVHSIEASSYVADYVRRSLQDNWLAKNVTLHHAAAWNQSNQTERMYIPNGEGWAHAGLGLAAHAGPRDWEEVQTLALDDIPLTLPVSLIKIDVQGADWFALDGAKAIMQRDGPTVIFEYESVYDAIFEKNWGDYQRLIDSVNYEIIGSVENNQHDFICRPRK
jgi:FkbM family methyltransferase